jgi:hypothetical protein
MTFLIGRGEPHRVERRKEGDTTEEDKSSYLLTADLCPDVWLNYKPDSARIL